MSRWVVTMTMPRRITPGDTWMITRRVAQRMFLLRPEKTINGIFEYCLAEAAERHNIVVIAWTVMSNHYHAVVHDPEGCLPAFLERFHKHVAKCVNALYDRWENVWSTEETCCTRLVTPDDVVDKVVYVLANPVAAGLVDTAGQWPGASSWALMGREAVTRRRPNVFFKKRGTKMPETAALRAQPPPGLTGTGATNWVQRVRKAVAAVEAELARKRGVDGLRVLGRKGVLQTSPFAAPRKATRRRKLRPSLACKNEQRMIEARELLRGFWTSYYAALEAFRSGTRDVLFPPGTYRMRTLGVCCHPHPERRAA